MGGLLVKDVGEPRTELHVLVMLRDEVVPQMSLAVAYLVSNDSHGKATFRLDDQDPDDGPDLGQAEAQLYTREHVLAPQLSSSDGIDAEQLTRVAKYGLDDIGIDGLGFTGPGVRRGSRLRL